MILGPRTFIALKLADHSIGCLEHLNALLRFTSGSEILGGGNLSWDRNTKHFLRCDHGYTIFFVLENKIWKKMRSLHHLLYRKERHMDLFRVCCVTFHSSSIWCGLTFQDHTRNGWVLPTGLTSFLQSLSLLFYVCYS